MTLGKLDRVRHPERVVRVWGRRCNFEGPTEVGWLVLGSAEEVRIGELLNRYLDRRARGESITEHLITAEHPDLAGELLLHLNMLKTIEPPELTIKQLVGKKILAPATSSDWSAELGPYRITGVIGRGGMGIVLRAHDPSLGRPVALKLLRPELAVDRRALVRFEHEAKAAAALRHPNIVTVYACGECDGSRFLAMELVDGPSLAELLVEGPELPTDEIRRMFRELLEGLAAAHTAGLIHRDIKSSNILLDGHERRVKIADFGLARISSAQTRITMPQAAVGTPEYMSPEQARGDEDIDHRTDLYSAGVVLYEMLTGRVPFRADTSSAVIHAILNVDPPEPASVRRGADPQLSCLALRLMAKRREDRFGSADEALEVLVGRRRVRVRGRGRRRIVKVGATVVALTAFIAAALWFTIRSRSGARLAEAAELVMDHQGHFTDAIRVTYTDGSEDLSFRPFPGRTCRVTNAAVAVPGPGRTPILLVCMFPPIQGDLLHALDGAGNRLWGFGIANPWHWPDSTITRELIGQSLVAGELDAVSGHEIVLTVHDEIEYASALVVFENGSPTPRATYWHAGHMTRALLAPDLLGPGRAAIVVHGFNNLLEGVSVPVEKDDAPVANYEYVPVVMVLDYAVMRGERVIGVPALGHRLAGATTVLPESYAFLNVVHDAKMPYRRVRVAAGRPPRDEDIMSVVDVSITWYRDGAVMRQGIAVDVRHQGDASSGIRLDLAADLRLIGITPSAGAKAGLDLSYWNQRYHVIVRGGEIVPEYRAGYPNDAAPSEPD